MSVLTMHTTMAVLRRHGIEAETPLLAVDGDGVGGREDASAALFTVSRLVIALPPSQLDVCAAELARMHPVLRAMAAFAPTMRSWIEIACRAWRTTHPALCWSSSLRGESLCLSFAGCAPGLEGFAWLTSHVMRHTPALVGGVPLEPLEVTPTSSTYGIDPTSAADDSTWSHLASIATGIPLSSVLATFAAVSPSAPPSVSVAPHLDVPRRDKVHPFARRHGLTPTETAVLRAIGDGARPADAAVELGIAVATVRVHLKRIFSKTGAHTQRQLLAQLDSEVIAFDPGVSVCARSA
jgi:DNA-binding CsgD family transcriptional regulator